MQVSAEGREKVNICRERLKMRFEDMRCCRCCSFSRSVSVVALDVEQMSIGGGSHVTLTSHVRVGMGHRS